MRAICYVILTCIYVCFINVYKYIFLGLKETTEKLVKEKMEGNDQLTPWEQYLQKRKEKKKEKRKGKKVNVSHVVCASSLSSSLTHKRFCLVQEAAEAEPVISDDELPADVDLDDPFFKEELGSTG